MNILLTLTTAGADTGPFDLFSDANGYTAAFETNVDKASLVAGYTTIAPSGSTIIRVKSTGLCTNFVDINLSSDPTPTVNTFSDQPFGVKGALNVTQGSSYNIILTGSPFTMSPFQVTPTSQNPPSQDCNNCKAVINFINTESSADILSFTLTGTNNADAFFNPHLRIYDETFGVTYDGVFQNSGAGTGDKVINFNIGSQKGRTFRFLDGGINLQYIS
jgi:hypothetical protein